MSCFNRKNARASQLSGRKLSYGKRIAPAASTAILRVKRTGTIQPYAALLFVFMTCLLFCCPAYAAGPSPEGAGLALLPQRVKLYGKEARQQLLVEVMGKQGFAGEAEGPVRISSSNSDVARVSPDGIVKAVGDGSAIVTVTTGDRQATAEVTVTATNEPVKRSFSRHVLPVLSKMTCNSGACHGALAGKGGLKLSLRGYDAAADYNALTRQALGRRVRIGSPNESLLLLKPTMKVPHGGGMRMESGSPDERILMNWISGGAPPPLPTDATVARLEVFPEEAVLKPGQSQRVLVRAVYSDGQEEDVTRWVKFGTSDSMVASVDESGRATIEGPGEAAITVWFSSKVAFTRVSVPQPGATDSKVFAEVPRYNFVDELILKKLERLNIPPSPPADDADFVRRAYLDAIGVPPALEEAKAFLDDPSPDKRAKLVDQLLRRLEYADYWSYKWSDMLLVSTRKLSSPAMFSFSRWIKDSVAANKPWDRFAREILTAKGSNLDNGAANYYVLHKSTIDRAETTSQAFLGMSLTCARCHNHPMEKWTQNDYYQFANLFTRIRLKNGDRPGETLVMAADTGEINHPRLGKPLPPRPLDGELMPLDAGKDRREALADWITSEENPYFARAVVNRVWRNFMGRGLVEAEDDLRLTNPPSNEELLDALAKDFSSHGYDMRRLIRTIMTSAAYSRSSEPLESNATDSKYYSRYFPRRLPAEVILDSISQVTGVPTEFSGYPAGTRALQLPDSQVGSYFLSAFGRPQRAITCSCERQQEPSLAQTLHLANGDTLNDKLRKKGGLIDRLIEKKATDDEALDALYLAALSRPPTEKERSAVKAALAETQEGENPSEESRRQALEDLFWATLTTREFLFNH